MAIVCQCGVNQKQKLQIKNNPPPKNKNDMPFTMKEFRSCLESAIYVRYNLC